MDVNIYIIKQTKEDLLNIFIIKPLIFQERKTKVRFQKS
jgi:hypothetical protein